MHWSNRWLIATNFNTTAVMQVTSTETMMQALVDSNYIFRDIVVGWPESVHDKRVFSNSQLYARGCSGRLFHPEVKEEI